MDIMVFHLTAMSCLAWRWKYKEALSLVMRLSYEAPMLPAKLPAGLHHQSASTLPFPLTLPSPRHQPSGPLFSETSIHVLGDELRSCTIITRRPEPVGSTGGFGWIAGRRGVGAALHLVSILLLTPASPTAYPSHE